MSSYTVCPACHGRDVNCLTCDDSGLVKLSPTDQEQVARMRYRVETHLRRAIEDLADASETAREYLPSADADEQCRQFSAAVDQIRVALGTLSGEQFGVEVQR
jgi:hypothetical protein